MWRRRRGNRLRSLIPQTLVGTVGMGSRVQTAETLGRSSRLADVARCSPVVLRLLPSTTRAQRLIIALLKTERSMGRGHACGTTATAVW